jgi:5-methyltetrahydrofolate--homocysteine methyltransferase
MFVMFFSPLVGEIRVWGKLENSSVTEAAKRLRQKQTEAERKLWFKLRDNQVCGNKFRRQEPIGTYIVDFVNFEKKLIVEVDGSSHNTKNVKMNDVYRTQWLQSQGFKVVRFWNSDILNNFEK